MYNHSFFIFKVVVVCLRSYSSLLWVGVFLTINEAAKVRKKCQKSKYLDDFFVKIQLF